MKILLNCIYSLGLAVVGPKVLYRAITQKRYRTGWGNRFGKVSRRLPDKKCLWIHAVSVGEVNATKTLIAQLKESLGDFEIVISTTTDTGFATAQKLYGKDLEVFYFPLDFSFVMARAFDNIRPDVCLLMELELWPNFVQTAYERGIPVVVVNGRLSDKSFPKYIKFKRLVRWIFEKLSLVLAQTDEYAKRFITLGCTAERVLVTGSLKYDTAEVADKVAGADQLRDKLNIGNENLWVTGGTGPGEEAIILEVYQKLKQQKRFGDLRLALVPRKPERFDEVAGLIREKGFSFVRYSEIKKQTANKPIDKTVVILGDTMGDLRKFYSIATIVFVGRTLVPMGGSDMMEAAALGKCTIFGPYAFNFQQTVEALLAGKGAIEVKDGRELLEIMEKCLADKQFTEITAVNGQAIIKKNQGATEKTVQAIVKLVSSRSKTAIL